MQRRKFLKTSIGTAAALAVMPGLLTATPKPSAGKLPRWRGFNLLEKFNGSNNQPFAEEDFKIMAGWGFDFARLPMSYQCWSKPDNWLKMDENVLREIDQAVEFGDKYNIHINLNFHRIPGYCVNPPAEPLNLWRDEKAMDAAAFHWAHFAKRYKGIPSKKLSFDLINEPANVEEADYVRVISRLAQAIRAEDRKRLIIADGLQYGTKPVRGLIPLKLGQSTRGYGPMQISHYKASWVNGSDTWASPQWPLTLNENDTWNKEKLKTEIFAPWKALAADGVGVHVGEWGAYNKTPHDVVLAWMEDNLKLWKEYGWGWSFWNLRGQFGVLNSERSDVAYESFAGHQLDRKMLNLLTKY